MKLVRKVAAFTSKSKLSIAFVLMLATFSMLVNVQAVSRTNDRYLNYRIVSNSSFKNAYLFSHSVNRTDLIAKNGDIDVMIKETIATLRNNPVVNDIYTVRVSPVGKYDIFYTNIVFYSKGLIEQFPEFKRMGVDFSAVPGGCILSNNLYSNIKLGETRKMEFGHPKPLLTIELKTSGHISYPYKHLALTSGGNVLYADDLLANDPVILMEEDSELIDKISAVAAVRYHPGIIFTLTANADKREIDKLFEYLKDRGTYDSFDDIIKRSRISVLTEYKEGATIPLFLAFVSFSSYLCIVILIVYKKERELAVAYLCGAKQSDIVLVLFGFISVLTLIPALINIIFILISPHLELPPGYFFSEMYLTPDLIWVVFAYFAATMVVSLLAALLIHGRKTPVELLGRIE